MKRKTILPLIVAISMLTSCDMEAIKSGFEAIISGIVAKETESESESINPKDTDSTTESNAGRTSGSVSASVSESSSSPVKGDYTQSEKNTFNSILGFVLPYVEDGYVIDNLLDTEGYFNFYIENPKGGEDVFDPFFNELCDLITYKYNETDSYEIVWSNFRNDKVEISVAYYESEDEDGTVYEYLDLYAYPVISYSELDAILVEMFGETIPHFEDGIDFTFNDYYTYYGVYEIVTYDMDETMANAYLEVCDALYPSKETYSEDGIDGIVYQNDNICLDIAPYESNGNFVFSIYVYEPEGTGGGSLTGKTLTLTSKSLDLGNYGTNLSVYQEGTKLEFKTTSVGDYGYGMQFKKNAGTIWNVTPLTDIAGIELNYTNGTGSKAVDYAFTIEYSNSSSFTNAYTDYVDIESGDSKYASVADAEYKYFRIKNTSSGALYLKSIVVYCEEGENGGSNTGDGHLSEYDSSIQKRSTTGLPQGTNGVYTVNFKNADFVDKTADWNYEYGCPSVGSPNVLVVGVEFSDILASSKGYSLDDIKNAFLPKEETKYSGDAISVADYYSQSSYGKLNVNFEVYDEWFKPSHDSSYYKNYTMDYYGYDIEAGDQLILDELLDYLSNTKGVDLSKYDTDGNEAIDGVIMISTVPVGETTFEWAYMYWNLLVDDNEEYYTYNGVSADSYIWASFEFLHERDYEYDLSYPLTSYTFIHEFGHMLGANDYYDTEDSEVVDPVKGWDVMSITEKDHCMYTKFFYGWVDGTRLITTTDTVTVNLENAAKNGDSIILAANFDPSLGLFQDYYVLEFYRYSGLNVSSGLEETTTNLEEDDQVLLYHVNSFLYVEEEEGTKYYSVYNNNTASGEYASEDNLLEFVGSYKVGDTQDATLLDDYNELVPFAFTIDSFDGDNATITFTRYTETD